MHDDDDIDDDGKQPKKRVLPDGATMRVPMGFYDHFSDGTPDYTHPSRPGFRFLDVDDPSRIAAATAYAERSVRMSTAWKRKGEQQDTVNDAKSPPAASAAPPRRTLADLQQSAATAYEAKCERMRNAWRHD